MSFPNSAEVLVNWVPANCMPSPESPQKRTVASSRLVIGLVGVVVAIVADNVLHAKRGKLLLGRFARGRFVMHLRARWE